MAPSETLLILMPFTPDPGGIAGLEKSVPGIKIHMHKIEMYTKELPDLPADLWRSLTALYTWKLFPTREQAPNLRYVQLHSAGCNQILGLPLFENNEDISFCTSNGVHPPQITEWVFASFLGFQHHCEFLVRRM